MTRLLRSLSFRLAIAYAGLFCLSVALLMGAVYWLRVAVPLDNARIAVDDDARQYTQLIETRGLAAAGAALDRRAHSGATRKPFHTLIAPDGEILTSNLPSWPRKAAGGQIMIEADSFNDGFEIDHSALVRDHVFADGTRLLIGRDVEDIVREKELLQMAAFWLFGGTVVLGLTGGWLMSRAIGARIEIVTSAARQVMEGDLSGRVPLRGTNDDFDRLNETLNLMLSRNQSLFEAVRRVSDNVAHELRTPLARLVGKLEEIEERAGEDAEMRTAIEEAIAEAHRLRRIFAALVRISRLEGGRHALSLQYTDVVQLLEDVVEFYQPEAERRGIELVLEAERPMVADLDLDLVFQAMSNLLDNALKYVPPGSRIVVSAALGEVLALTVSDNGPGLAPSEFERVKEQFFRGEAATGMAGEGLGLSMVSAIAHVHGGDLLLADNAPGLMATFAFPPGAVTGIRKHDGNGEPHS
ncbi:HAMP domain-containing sensor histidine kinase [Novosphingobium sp. BL-8A]|uniref:sensor histidine kinase n=1 Tax=Novosphingobium sp. BL-8A TaxID=3127639 RepID=UPI0037583C10